MKPLKLRFQAFGSFPELVEIDFDSLAPRGVFVVSGDTGTGKTTIFDAMCWALYGEMPLKDSGGVRSDHAPESTETFVELTFECDGVRYVVTRRPSRRRPAKRGSGMATEKASASLVRLGVDGSQSLATSVTETSSRCEALVGLDATQFQRVVLLPQGEFAKFLLSGTGERETLLGKLFGAQVFDDMVDYLKAHSDELESELRDAEADIKARLDNARESLTRVHEALGLDVPGSLGFERSEEADSPPEPSGLADRGEVGSLRQAVIDPLEQFGKQVGKLKDRFEEAAGAHSDAESAAARFDQVLGHLETVRRLDESEHEVTDGEAAARRSQQARPVDTEARRLAKAVTRQTQDTEARDERVAAISRHLSGLGATPDTSSAASITATLQDHGRVNDEQASILRVKHQATEAYAEAEKEHAKVSSDLEAAHKAHLAATTRVTEIEESELPALRDHGADTDSLQTQIDVTKQSIERSSALDTAQADLKHAREKEGEASDEHKRVFASFVASQAPRLADSLVDGEPCPVCGSDVHPAPAVVDPASATSSADLEKAAKAQRRAADAVNSAEVSVAKLRGELGDQADLSIDELKTKRTELEAALGAAKKIVKRIGDLERELADKQAQASEGSIRIAGLEAHKANAETQLGTAEEALAGANKAADGIDAAVVQERAKAIGLLSDLVVGLNDLFISVATADSAVEQVKQHLDEALDASPFDSVDDALMALLDEDDEKARLDAAQRHRDERKEAIAALRTLDEQGVPAERPDLDITGQAKASTEHDYAEASRTFAKATDNTGYCDTALQDHDALVSGSEGLRADRDRAKRAHEVCSKGGALSMSLKRWVLTRELDRVTAAANVHLARMTAHRYSLRRRSDRADARRSFGLDLEVLDATTGRPRSTTTLSGGEQFQASLALALGLADVVSHGGSASGKRFEALFVDEGFGSLDPQSLDDAIEALHQLHATGRMVGAITHVEAMKQQLHVGIEVKRLPDGAGSTLVVHP